MHIIMGGTGHVGSETAKALLKAGEAAGIITRDASGADALRGAGAEIIEANVDDISSLLTAFRRGRRAFLLNPPSDTSKGSDAIERRQVANILAAVDAQGLKRSSRNRSAAPERANESAISVCCGSFRRASPGHPSRSHQRCRLLSEQLGRPARQRA